MENTKAYQEQLLEPVLKVINECPYGPNSPSSWQVPEGYELKKVKLSHSVMEQIIPKEAKNHGVILHLHGGGYAYSLLDSYREGAIVYSKVAGDIEVFSLDYRTVPTAVYPAALEDAVEAYKWLLAQGYSAEKIIIVGDSAGGNLCLATTLYLRDHKLPLPKAVIALSPWADLKMTAKSHTAHIPDDLILGKLRLLEEVKKPSYLGDADINDPYVSPINGDYTGFPKLLIQVGSHEILLDDSIEVARRAKEAGVDVSFTIYEGMSHDFQLFLPMLEQGQAAWKEIEAFIKKVFQVEETK